MCDCWDIWNAEYNRCRHGKLSKGFIWFILFAWQYNCTYVKDKGSNLFTLTKCFINNHCFLFATSIAMPIYRVLFWLCYVNMLVIMPKSTMHHKFALSMYLCFYNILTMCSRLSANEMLIQSLIWCCDKEKGRIWCVEVKVERGKLGCAKMKIKKWIKTLVW
jgi:hypothetical protein